MWRQVNDGGFRFELETMTCKLECVQIAGLGTQTQPGVRQDGARTEVGVGKLRIGQKIRRRNECSTHGVWDTEHGFVSSRRSFGLTNVQGLA